MPFVRTRTFIFLICLLICSCSKITDEQKKLIGVWVLDSVSTPSGKMTAYDESKVLTFKNSTDYSLKWMNGDVGNIFAGKYFVLYNPKRGLKTITFIPDIQMAEQDTIRIEYSNFDIVNIQDKTLQLVDETTFIKKDSLPYTRFNKKYIYKKEK